jgi:hypothetical protein
VYYPTWNATNEFCNFKIPIKINSKKDVILLVISLFLLAIFLYSLSSPSYKDSSKQNIQFLTISLSDGWTNQTDDDCLNLTSVRSGFPFIEYRNIDGKFCDKGERNITATFLNFIYRVLILILTIVVIYKFIKNQRNVS